MTKSKTFFGHPIGLATLFFTEMWERFSYYGMRALLLLFMVAPLDKGGMGFNDKTGGAIYGLYTMFVYLLALPGGWLADKFFGLRKSIFYGGCIIALGHFCLAFPFTETFFLGLFFIVTGTGLLKPNISSMVGELYSANEQVHRDNGFSIFYMGINIGGLIAPLICGYLGQKINWHYGFAAAGIGMVMGLIQYKLTEHTLGNAGLVPAKLSDKLLQSKSDNNIRTGLWISGVLILLFVSLLITRVITINPVILAKASLYVISICVAIYFIYILAVEKLSRDEKRKVIAISIIFVITAIFYAGYEGQGSSLNLFAERYTNLSLGKTFTMPASWLQAMPSIWIVVCVPLFAILWVWLAKRKLNPATPVKLVLGLLFMGLGYVVMIGASFVVMRGEQPLPTWLVTTYLLHTFGEICLYPIGLSAVTKLSPKHLVGRMMGVFFMALALGNLTSGIFAGEFDRDAVAANPHLLVDLFQLIAVVMLIAAFIVLLAYKPLKKLMGDIH
jgi:POT family proton-dependent oligopeptide transporter